MNTEADFAAFLSQHSGKQVRLTLGEKSEVFPDILTAILIGVMPTGLMDETEPTIEGDNISIKDDNGVEVGSIAFI